MASHTASTDAGDRGRPPGPSGLPWLGNAHRVVRDPFAFYDTLAEYGDVVNYQVAGHRFCALLHPEHVEQVLVGEADRFRRWVADEWDLFAGFGSEGLLQTEGEQWRRQRRLVQPAFTPERIRSSADAMVAYAERTADGWDDGEIVALNRTAARLTLDILTKSLFDLDVADREDVVADAALAMNDRADTSISTFLPSWLPTPSNRRYRRRMQAFESMVRDLIGERQSEGTTNDDLLSLLHAVETDDGTSLSRTEIQDNLLTFLFAGHETTSLALTYSLFLLAQHPDKRARLDDELATVLDGRSPTVDDRPRLTYTERVIKESLRLYPPAYITFREATEDVSIGGYSIPEGTKLSAPQFHLHTDGRFFDDPDAFRPERWTDEFEAALPEYAYFPFGGGPRHCIGMRFAMLELSLVLPTIAARADFELVSDPDPDFQLGVTLQPAADIELRVRKR